MSSDRKRAFPWCVALGIVLFTLCATQPVGCGTVTVRYDSSGKHPDQRR
jgi:hypothetical protein